MSRLAISTVAVVLSLATAACSGSYTDPIPDPTSDVSRNRPEPGSPSGDSPAAQTCAAAPELSRCASESPGDVAFVCDELQQDNTLDVRSGSLQKSCRRAVDIEALVRGTVRRGVTDENSRLARISQPTRVTLGCGRYRFDSLGIDNTLDLEITSDVVIVVDGDMRVASPTKIRLAPGARLDLLIGGRLQADNTLTITGGSTWLGVEGDVRIASPMRIDGSLVVPDGHVAADNTLEVDALYAESLRIASPLTIRGGARLGADGCVSP